MYRVCVSHHIPFLFIKAYTKKNESPDQPFRLGIIVQTFDQLMTDVVAQLKRFLP